MQFCWIIPSLLLLLSYFCGTTNLINQFSMAITCARVVCCFVLSFNVFATIVAAFFLSEGDGTNTNDDSTWKSFNPDQDGSEEVQTEAPELVSMEAKKND